MPIKLTGSEVNMVIVAIRAIRQGWQADKATKRVSAELADAEIRTWDELLKKISNQHEGE